MKALLRGQTDLSLASAAFYLSGVFFAQLMLWVFPAKTGQQGGFLVFLSVAAGVLAVLFIVLGRKVPRWVALGLASLSAAIIIGAVFLNDYEFRAMNTGLLFYAILMYLVWFGPMWWARAFGYTWLGIYAVGMWVQFDSDVRPFLVTLSCTAVMLAELVCVFKGRLEQNSLSDPLCGVWNKRAFEASLQRSVAVSQRNDRPLSLAFLDLNGFKEINDTRGHAAGDHVLQEFARGIDRNIRPQDVFARIGGDEFALILNSTTEVRAHEALSRLRREVDPIDWSYGIAELQAGDHPRDLVHRADAAMYQHKARDRGVSAADRLEV